MTLNDALANGRNNNLNLIRLLAAGLVVWAHAWHSQAEPFEQWFGLGTGDVGVDVFFFLSGLLVAKSFVARGFVARGFVEFAFARAKRIYPGLWVSLVLAVAVCSLLSPVDLWRLPSTWDYLARNALVLPGIGAQQDLPYAFDTVTKTFNVPLWTLPHEISMYVLLGVVGLLGGLGYKEQWPPINAGKWAKGETYKNIPVVESPPMTWGAAPIVVTREPPAYEGRSFTHQWPPAWASKRRVWPAVTIALIGVAGVVTAKVGVDVIGLSRARFLAFFFCGVSCYVLRDRVILRGWVALVLAAISAAVPLLTSSADVRQAALQLALPYVVLWLAFVPTWPRAYNRVGDYSYGLYIYGFPVQVGLVVFGVTSPLANFGAALLVAGCLAVASWHLVESRALRLRLPALRSPAPAARI